MSRCRSKWGRLIVKERSFDLYNFLPYPFRRTFSFIALAHHWSQPWRNKPLPVPGTIFKRIHNFLTRLYICDDYYPMQFFAFGEIKTENAYPEMVISGTIWRTRSIHRRKVKWQVDLFKEECLSKFVQITMSGVDILWSVSRMSRAVELIVSVGGADSGRVLPPTILPHLIKSIRKRTETTIVSSTCMH